MLCDNECGRMITEPIFTIRELWTKSNGKSQRSVGHPKTFFFQGMAAQLSPALRRLWMTQHNLIRSTIRPPLAFFVSPSLRSHLRNAR